MCPADKKFTQDPNLSVNRLIGAISFGRAYLGSIEVGVRAFFFVALIVLSACTHRVELSKIPNPERCLINLNMRLSDSNLGRHPLTSTPWKISKGEKPVGLALIEPEQLMAEGRTDGDGSIIIAEENNAAIRASMCERREKMWLVYPGQTVEIRLHILPPNATAEHELFLLMKSLGFFEGVDEFAPGFLNSERAASDLKLAKEMLELSDNDELLAKLREDRVPKPKLVK